MAEYIEREALIKHIERSFGEISTPFVVKKIKDFPTADFVEVKHGEWIKPYINRYGHPCHCCSVCGFKALQQDRNYFLIAVQI